MPGKLFVLPLALFGVRAEVDCGNGHLCGDGETCTSHELGAGLRFGCAPLPLANVCRDQRFSCAAGLTCDLDAELCRDLRGGKTQPLLGNTDAVAAIKAVMKAPSDKFCGVLSPHLPTFCTCTNKPLGADLFCKVGVLSLDTFSIKAELELCETDAARLNLEVSESTFGKNYTIAGVKGGVSKRIPIPGLNISIPNVGKAEVDALLGFGCISEQCMVEIGLDACATVAGKTECGKDVTKHLPLWILDKTFSLSDLCGPSKYASVLV